MIENRPDDTAEERLKETFFIVEATRYEQHYLWSGFAHNSPHRRFPTISLNWDQFNTGWSVQIGELDNRPVVMSMTWVRIDGKLVMFWHLCSAVADYTMAEKWLEEHFKGRYNNNARRAWTDAMNFHHCVHAIRDANKGETNGKL